jgi:nitroreductase
MTLNRKTMIEAAKKPVVALDYEIAREIASALGRLGRTLEQALQALARFDADHPHEEIQQDERAARRALVSAAGLALWNFVVQCEACGLRDSRQVMRDYRVPIEVQHRMGAVTSRVNGSRP